MRNKQILVLSPVLIMLACNTGKVVLDQGQTDYDARLISQVKVWDCIGGSDTGGTEQFHGTYGHELFFYHAPSSLNDLLPQEGCVYGMDVFSTSAGANASSLEGLVGYPEWQYGEESGYMEGGFGFWYQDVMTDEHTCEDPQDILDASIVLGNAQAFSGAEIPSSFPVPDVDFTGFQSLIDFGDTVEVTWSETRWPRVWAHLRRTKDGQVVEMMTCRIPSGNSFVLDSAIWEQMNETFNVDVNQLYIGFENREMQETVTGQWVETLNRSIAVAVQN